MIITPTEQSFIVTSSAALLEDDHSNLKAWAERCVRPDPDIRWILGNYVEADQANNNGHIFPLEDLAAAQASLAGKSLNMMHRSHYIVGYFSGAQLLTSEGAEMASGEPAYALAAAEMGDHPYVEAVAGMWHNLFPEEYYNIRRAHKEGSLFFSMEAVPEAVSCPSCEHHVAFAGLESSTYCAHMQGATGPKRLHKPTFGGGAIIIPPNKPGWTRADVKTISKEHDMAYEGAEALRADLEEEAPHLSAREWEAVMGQVVTMAKFPDFLKKKDDKDGTSKDGEAALRKAIKEVGKSKNPEATKMALKKRAKSLGLMNLIPKGW